MSQLIRLVYASRSNAAKGPTQQGLDPGVARILAKSRRNNARLDIVGSLLFGDGCFLQCLEGVADKVDALYDRIRTDPRHRDVRVLSRTTIDHRSFDAWSMKYAPGEEALRRLMQTLKATRFDPYALSPADLAAVVGYMAREADMAPGVESAPAPAPAPAAGGRERPVSAIDTFEPRQSPAKAGSVSAARSPARQRIQAAVAALAALVLIAGSYLLLKA